MLQASAVLGGGCMRLVGARVGTSDAARPPSIHKVPKARAVPAVPAERRRREPRGCTASESAAEPRHPLLLIRPPPAARRCPRPSAAPQAANRSFKCPYCPAECTPKDCQELVFPDMQ